MARGIEHRNPETLMSSFDNFGLGKWAIYSGTDQAICYDGEDIDAGKERLENQLAAIEQSGTNTVYALRVYADDIKDINKKTPFKGSTTFMFGGAPVKTENGIMILDRQGAAANYRESRVDPAMQSQLSLLQEQLEDEREKRHKAELESLRTDFKHQIAGLSDSQVDEKSTVDKVIGLLSEKPEMAKDVITAAINGIGELFKIFIPNKLAPAPQQPVDEQYLVHQFEAAPVNGTNGDTAMSDTNINGLAHEEEEDNNEELTPEDEALNDRIDAAIDVIVDKIGLDETANALDAIAKMSKVKLKGILAFM